MLMKTEDAMTDPASTPAPDEGVPVSVDAYHRRPWQQRLRDRIAFGLMRLALFLTGNRY